MARHGILGILRHHWKVVLIAMALVAATQSAGYMLTSYMPPYLEKTVGLNSTGSAVATVPVLVVLSISLPFIGILSDRIGRRAVYLIAVGTTLVLMVPAFWIMQQGGFWNVQIALFLVAIPVACYVSLGASALPALFPTASRFGAMALAFNLSVSLFGGTTGFFSQALIEMTGNNYMPAFYVMFFAVLGGIAAFKMDETAQRPLVGSMPTVETKEEARELVATQDENPLIDTSTMPIMTVTPEELEKAKAAGK